MEGRYSSIREQKFHRAAHSDVGFALGVLAERVPGDLHGDNYQVARNLPVNCATTCVSELHIEQTKAEGYSSAKALWR